MKKYFASVLFLVYSISSAAQQVSYRPIQFQQFFNSYSIVNPASAAFRNRVEFQSGRQQHAGIWKHISTTFASAATRFNVQAKKFQVVGVSFIADNEGQYLKRSRLHLTYGWHSNLSKKVSLGAGASLGAFSFRVVSSHASVSAVANAFDALVGVWLYSDKYYLGISGNQIFNNRLTPLQEATRLIRHTNITGSYSFFAGSSFEVAPHILLRYAKGFPLDVDLSLMGTLNDIVVAGVNYRHHKNVVPMIGFQQIKVGSGAARLMFSYGVPAGAIAENVQTYELTLAYEVKPPKKKVVPKKKTTLKKRAARKRKVTFFTR